MKKENFASVLNHARGALAISFKPALDFYERENVWSFNAQVTLVMRIRHVLECPMNSPVGTPLTTGPLLGWEICIFLLTHEVEHVRLMSVSTVSVKLSIDGWHFRELRFKKSACHEALREYPLGPYMSHSIASNANLVAFLMQYISTMHFLKQKLTQ